MNLIKMLPGLLFALFGFVIVMCSVMYTVTEMWGESPAYSAFSWCAVMYFGLRVAAEIDRLRNAAKPELNKDTP